MRIFSTYSVKIKEYSHIFEDTISLYRKATDFFIRIILKEPQILDQHELLAERLRCVEILTNKTEINPFPKYDFGKDFYKFPCYLRRAAISEALGKVSSYKSNLKNWNNRKNKSDRKRKPGYPRAGRICPAMYKGNTFIRTGTYSARIKVWIRNTWDWIDISFRKPDIDYITNHCQDRKECVPTLQKRGKEWFLDFVFKEYKKLNDTPDEKKLILAVDLGINNACVCSAMKPDGTIMERKFLSLPKEQDSQDHALNKIRKAHNQGNRKMPNLWARANGINEDITQKTVRFIIDTAAACKTDVIVFEHLDLKGKKYGAKKQRLHLWKAQRVQALVTDKAHRLGMHISHVNARGTSGYAFDGSGKVQRGAYLQNGEEKYNYSICVFRTGKTYNCDLNASYNIGARYFIRNITESLSEEDKLSIEAKVPRCFRRSTCTWIDLINLNAALAA